ncbi:MAG: hypothetical protein AAGA29_03700 [Planctomycetota bacterium]
MKYRYLFPTFALVGAVSLGSAAWLQAGQADTDADSAVPVEIADTDYADAVRDLLAAEPGPERDAAAERFRQLGPDAFAVLYEALTPTIQQYRAAKGLGSAEQADELEPLVRLLDTVAQQRDAYAAGLYWHTDLDDAKAQAQATGKPILSLRMLGNLDDEYSCANSRFFRTALYADTELGNTLRNDFVLHWQSVRPVPVITIDMGDGRVIRRTITGNSCHLVLDTQGRPVDVIPGLYGPRTFEAALHRAGEMSRKITAYATTAEERQTLLDVYHLTASMDLDERWAELTPAGPQRMSTNRDAYPAVFPAIELDSSEGADELAQMLAVPGHDAATFPDAQRAGQLARGKEIIEMPLLDAMDASADLLFVLSEPAAETVPDARDAAALVVGKSDVEMVLVDAILPRNPMHTPASAPAEVWHAVAAHYAEGATLDHASRRLMTEKTVPAEEAARMAFSKSYVENPLLAMIQNFEGAIALDTARNEHLLHRQIHQWFVDGEAPSDPDALTSRVYAELFLTPDEDPWLGLVPPDTYSALDAGGLETCDAP